MALILQINLIGQFHGTFNSLQLLMSLCNLNIYLVQFHGNVHIVTIGVSALQTSRPLTE
jgi:hypothetical protein